MTLYCAPINVARRLARLAFQLGAPVAVCVTDEITLIASDGTEYDPETEQQAEWLIARLARPQSANVA